MDTSVYQHVLRELRRTKASPRSVRDGIGRLQHADPDLEIYLAEVLQVLSSRFLPQESPLDLPLDQPPFKPLIDYCERRMRIQGRS